jgi:pimeloyl-ACP methyl ester carboxylesterase
MVAFLATRTMSYLHRLALARRRRRARLPGVPHEHRDAPGAVIAALEADATRLTTRFEGGGAMIWRRWGEGLPLVLLHGSSGSWTHWIRNIPALAARRAVLVPDMPGFGDSDTLPEPHTAERLAAGVATGLETLLPPAADFDLIGFSFGSIIAGVVATTLGRRVGRLVLIGPGGMALRSDVGSLALARVERGMSEAEAREVHRENLRRLMLGDPTAADDLAVHLQVENLRRTRFRSGTIPSSDVLLRALPRIQARLAAIFGERDAFVGRYLDERRQTLARVQPGLDVRVVEGAGHWVNNEAAETVDRALVEMLAAPPGR